MTDGSCIGSTRVLVSIIHCRAIPATKQQLLHVDRYDLSGHWTLQDKSLDGPMVRWSMSL